MIGIARMRADLNGEEDYLGGRKRDFLKWAIFPRVLLRRQFRYSQSQGLITVPKVDRTTRAECGRISHSLLGQREVCRGLEGSNLLVIKEIDAAVIASLMMGEDGATSRFLLICMLVQLLKQGTR